MALEPITRQEQIIAGKDLQPITRMEKFLKDYGGGGSGGGVQSDLNQNDPTKADYVKNRTHYSEIKEIVVEYVGEPGEVLLDNFPEFAVGDTVTVTVDGVEHSLVAFGDHGAPVIGDPPEAVFEETGELGWFISYGFDGEIWFVSLEPHTIRYRGEVVHKLDNKYIPVIPLSKVEKGEYLGLDIVGYIESHPTYDFVDNLSNTAAVFSVDPSIDLFTLPRIGFFYLRAPGVGAITRDGEYFVEYEATEFPGNATIKAQRYVFVRSDAVEEGVAEYKDAVGIE